MISLPSADAICTGKQLGEVIGKTSRQVERLAASGILKPVRRKLKGARRYHLSAAVQAYLAYREKYVTERLKLADDGYNKARARRMQAGAELEELRLLEEKGQLHREDDLDFLLTLKYTAFKARLLACPSRLMHSLVGLHDSVVINQKITDEIYLALTELSKPDYGQGRAQRQAYLQGKLEEVAQERNGERPLNGAQKKEIAKLAKEPEDNLVDRNRSTEQL